MREVIERDRQVPGGGFEDVARPAPANSIAVLPFSVCAGGEADKVLAAGLAAEVINRLAGVGTLKVIARASSFTIAGFNLHLRQIAQPLRVKYLLTGELCREGGTLVLRVELVDELGYVVWNERYEQAPDRAGLMGREPASSQPGRPASVPRMGPAEISLAPGNSLAKTESISHERRQAARPLPSLSGPAARLPQPGDASCPGAPPDSAAGAFFCPPEVPGRFPALSPAR